jgi:membrane protein YqaA with SNARE-associated domain
MVAIFMFSIFLLKQNQEPQWIVQIIDAIIGFINSPLFAKFGPIGLFVNGVFSTFIPFPPEVTAISLILAGISRTEILAILVTSWIIGAAVGYYIGLSGKELINIFRGKRKKIETLKADKDNRNTLSNNASNDNEKIQQKNAEADDDNKKNNENKMGSSSNRYHRLLERYGWAIIFISPWIPIIGDIIPLIAGAKRYEIKKFMIAIAAGKIARAVAVIFFGSYLASLSGQMG